MEQSAHAGARLEDPTGESTTPPGSSGELRDAVARLLALPEGERKVGPFVLLRQLGRGAFAPVWLAREEYGGIELRSVAVKLFALQPGHGSLYAPESQTIVREARALCRVEHPNIVCFYSIALDQPRGVLALAMEYLSGRPLDSILDENGCLSVAETIDIGIALALALAALHGSGIVHRDVKPGNIVKTATSYKLIDLGLASRHAAQLGVEQRLEEVPTSRCSRRSERRRTTRPLRDEPDLLTLCGTPGYIDPECIDRLSPASPASDLYALGASLFELLTGKLPSEVGGLGDRIRAGRSLPPAVRSLRRDVPVALGKLINALLQPRVEDRPSSAEWLAARLRMIRDSHETRPDALKGSIVNAGVSSCNDRAPSASTLAVRSGATPRGRFRQYGFHDPPLPNGKQATVGK